ncbi:hypothetical protein Tco_0161709 [Tanacetum coccineum]
MKLNPKKRSFKMEEGKFLGYIVTSEGIRANPKKTKAMMDMPSPSNLKQMESLSGKPAALNRFLSNAAKRAIPSKLLMLTTPIKDEELMVYLSAANEVGVEINYAPMEKIGRSISTCSKKVEEILSGSHNQEGSTSEALEMTGNKKENKATVPEDKAETWKRYTDRASNEHGLGTCLILIDPNRVEYSCALRLHFDNSNNDQNIKPCWQG